MNHEQPNKPPTIPPSRWRCALLSACLLACVVCSLCSTAQFAHAEPLPRDVSPADYLVDASNIKSTSVSNGSASLQWSSSETQAIWYYVYWTGNIAAPGTGFVAGENTPDGGWGFMRSTNCTGDTVETCDTASVWRQVNLYVGATTQMLHMWAAPVTNAANYKQLAAIAGTVTNMYQKQQTMGNDLSDVRYYVYSLHYADMPKIEQQLTQLSQNLQDMKAKQDEQAEADKAQQDNAKEQQTETEKLKGEGDKGKYESDSQAQQNDLNSATDSLRKAFDGDVSLGNACRWDFKADGSRLNLGTLDFCAGEIPPQIQRILSLGLFITAFALPVRAVKIFRDAQVSARDDASSDKLEKHVEVIH